MNRISTVIAAIIVAAIMLCLTIGCDGEGEDMGTSPTVDGGSSSGITHRIYFQRPSPCQRINGVLYINLSAADQDKVKHIIVTLNNATIAYFEGPPFSSAVYPNVLPPDGEYTLQAVAKYNDGKTVTDEIFVRLDNSAPFQKNILILDSQADPYGIGGTPGALFRYDPVSKRVCVVASGDDFVEPTGMVMENADSVIIADYASDKNGDAPGVGTIFRVLLDRRDGISVLSASGFFRGPIGVDIDPDNGTIYVADFDADPFNLGGASGKPGAILSVDPLTGNTSTVMSSAQFVSPAYVTALGGGDLWISDTDASALDPINAQYRGSVWSYDIGSGVLDLTSVYANFRTPFGTIPDASGNMLLTDSGDAASSYYGSLYLVDPTSADPVGNATVLHSGLPLRQPAGIIYFAEEDIYLIADRNASPNLDNKGAVMYYDATLGEVGYYVTSSAFVEPFAVAISSY